MIITHLDTENAYKSFTVHNLNLRETPPKWSPVVTHDLDFAAGAKDLNLSLNLGPIPAKARQHYLHRYHFWSPSHKPLENTFSNVTALFPFVGLGSVYLTVSLGGKSCVRWTLVLTQLLEWL